MRVRLVAVTTAGEHVLPPYLAAFRARCPEAEVHLEVGTRSRVWELLGYREVDLVIGGRPPPSGRFVTLATRPNRRVVVAPSDRATMGSGTRRDLAIPVSVQELAAQVWLVREPGSGTRSTVEELFEDLGISPATLTPGLQRIQSRVGQGRVGRDVHLPRRRGSRAGA